MAVMPQEMYSTAPCFFVLQDSQKQVMAHKELGIFKVQFKSLQQEVDLVITEGPSASLLGMN